MRALRSDALHRLLLDPRGEVATVEEIAELPDLRGWDPTVLEVAIADLVADGVLVDDERGRVRVAEVSA